MGKSQGTGVAVALLAAAVMAIGGCGSGARYDAGNPSASAPSSEGPGVESTTGASQHHVLPDYQVERLKDELQDFPTQGRMIEFTGPVPSYTEVDGARMMQHIQNEAMVEFGADKSYTLTAMCTGEGGVNVEWRFGVQFSRRHLECRPYIGTRYMNAGVADMGVTGIGADASTVTITPDEGTKAEIAYRIDESDAPVPIMDDDVVSRRTEAR